MLETDIAFLSIILFCAFTFMILTFVYKGIVWFPIVDGVMWVLMGAYLIQKLYNGEELFAFQYFFGLLSLGIAIAMFFAPMYAKAKNADIERNAPDDIDLWDEKAFERHLESKKEREKREGKKGGL